MTMTTACAINDTYMAELLARIEVKCLDTGPGTGSGEALARLYLAVIMPDKAVFPLAMLRRLDLRNRALALEVIELYAKGAARRGARIDEVLRTYPEIMGDAPVRLRR